MMNKKEFLDKVKKSINEYGEDFSIATLQNQCLQDGVFLDRGRLYMVCSDGCVPVSELSQWASAYIEFKKNNDFYINCVESHTADPYEIEAADWFWVRVYNAFIDLGGEWGYLYEE